MLSLYIRRVPVPDERYDWLCAHWKPPSTIPAYLSVVDIAGLVKGAHEGQVSTSVSECEDSVCVLGCVYYICVATLYAGTRQCILIQHQCL